MANRLEELRNLSRAVPGLNKEAEKRARAATQVQLQQQLGGVPAQAPVTPVAQSLAQRQAAARQQVAASAQQQAQAQQSAIGQQALQAQGQAAQQQQQQRAQTLQAEQTRAGLAQQKDLSKAEIESRKRTTQADIKSAQRVQRAGMEQDNKLQLLTIKQREDLARIGRDIKQQLFDSRMTFERDELGRSFSNDRQLADYTVANAKTEQEAQERLQQMQQASQRSIQLTEIALAEVEQQMKQEFQKAEAERDFAHQKDLAKMRAALQEKLRKEQADAANKAAIWNTVGTLAGIGIVAATGGGAAALMAGGAIGGGAGSILGGTPFGQKV
jgi:hypothetical protein